MNGALWQALVSWLPFLLIIGFWVFVMVYWRGSKTFKTQRQYVERNFQHMERVEALLERIATTTEQAAKRQ
jgi:ATP-dependent Zn protease